MIASFGTLVRDFLGDFFTFDSRFFRTIPPFFFRPGLLTRDYLAGHRVRYVGPIRILVFGSIILFALLGRKINQNDWELSGGDGPVVISLNEDADSLQVAVDSLAVNADSLAADGFPAKTDPDSSAALTVNTQTPWTQGTKRDENINQLLRQIPELSDSLKPEEIADKLVPDKSYWRRKFVVQSAKVYQSRGKNLVTYMIGNGTLIVLTSVFMQSLFIKLLYIRKKKHFIEHFIFTTYAHAAIVYWLIILLVVEIFTKSYSNWLMLVIAPYLFLSMLKVYEQGWLKTLLKYGIVTLTYIGIFLPVLAMLALGISFLFI